MWYLIFLAYKYNVQSGKNHCGHAYNSQVQEIIDLNKCKKERLFMEERDDLEQMAFIQKWNDGRKRSAACVHTAYRTPVFATNVIDRRTPRFNICASGAERNMPLKPDMAIHVAIGRDGRERYRHLRRAGRR